MIIMKIATGTVVAIRYRMCNSKGEELENTLNKEAVAYLHGAGRILPSLEACLEGMCAGQSRQVAVAATNTENLDDDLLFDIVIDMVRLATPEEMKAGKPANLVPESGACSKDCDCHQ
jgi:hypothetical protein